jgi:hypothetical protein
MGQCNSGIQGHYGTGPSGNLGCLGLPRRRVRAALAIKMGPIPLAERQKRPPGSRLQMMGVKPLDADVRIEGVFKTNGACKVRLLDDNRIVSGKITDPALGQPHNVYTTALNEGASLHVVAKPVLKNDKIHRLFISHAEIIHPDGSLGRTAA